MLGGRGRGSGTRPYLMLMEHGRVAAACVALIATLAWLAGCGAQAAGNDAQGSSSTVLRVFAAASLTDAFGEIGADFAQVNHGVTLSDNFGGSDTLAAQIAQGAPADVFASANVAQMSAVVKGGQVDAASVKTFAHNRLVVIYPAANPAHLRSLQDLANPGVKIDLAAQSVPAGQYALDFLTKASVDPSFGSAYKSSVLKNVVSYETDVKAVLAKVSLGEADAGIVYTTDAATKAASVGTLAIPDSLNSIAVYPIAPLKASAHRAAAQAFVDYLTSPQGQAVLAKYGFLAGSDGPQYPPPTG